MVLFFFLRSLKSEVELQDPKADSITGYSGIKDTNTAAESWSPWGDLTHYLGPASPLTGEETSPGGWGDVVMIHRD